jgi:hypothetical protein
MMLGHMVYFTLKQATPQARQTLIQDCRAYLTGHPGEVFFACGTLCSELERDVNVRDWDVALHIVFESKADHDAYQAAPRHEEFVARNRETWAKVRVFDSLVESA